MNKILSLLGLAKKAGKVIVGTDAVISKLQADKLYLIFVAKDSSAATIDKIEKKAFYYNVPIIKSFTSDELSSSIGQNNNKVLGISDKGFADACGCSNNSAIGESCADVTIISCNPTKLPHFMADITDLFFD